MSRRERAGTTPNREDYLERIYHLEKERGHARVVDIAESLAFSPSSVTRMLKRLADEGLVEYERYRAVVLTERGRRLGERIAARHASLEAFLRMIGVEDEHTIWQDVEGIEHHVSPATMEAIRTLTAFFEHEPACYERLQAFRQQAGEASEP
ncbi:MAG: transcriptional regulator MntR [Planctomycetota bacterium]|nr:MAG: transcriptional regulator MntR [Planctomycetota bacterium]